MRYVLVHLATPPRRRVCPSTLITSASFPLDCSPASFYPSSFLKVYLPVIAHQYILFRVRPIIRVAVRIFPIIGIQIFIVLDCRQNT